VLPCCSNTSNVLAGASNEGVGSDSSAVAAPCLGKPPGPSSREIASEPGKGNIDWCPVTSHVSVQCSHHSGKRQLKVQRSRFFLNIKHFWVKIKYCDCFQLKWSNINKNSFLAKSYFSSKNFARTVCEWGGKN
jgi:hypothetical protein